jgi:amino acid adenylation domain-containing protein
VTVLVHHLLSEAAATAPESEALRSRRMSWSYGRLETTANAMARALMDLGVRHGDRVGILLPKRPEAIAAIYGALKAGAAYVPLNVQAPIPYVAAIASDCALTGLVTTSFRAAQVLQAMGEPRPGGVVLVDQPTSPEDLPVPFVTFPEGGLTSDRPAPSVTVGDGDVACLVYTSGSTGVPKGVMQTHRALLASAQWFCQKMRLHSEDRIFAHAPLHFSMSRHGIFPSALSRATAVLMSLESALRGSDLALLVKEEAVTVWVSVPHPLRLLLASGATHLSLASLRHVICGGGSLVGNDVGVLRRLIPRAQIWQFYGSTESSTVCCSLVDEATEADGPLPIGQPLDDARVLVVGADGREVGPGGEGVLYVHSPRVMKGYWGDAVRTAEVMVPNPLDGQTGGPFYRSGDVVLVREDGNLEYVKRADQMVKSRGYRIEVGEVEAVLNTYPAAREAVAVPVPHPEWGTAIVACVEVGEGERASEAELKAHLAARLPAYMVPHRIVVTTGLPRTSSGKVDRQRLVADLLEN